MTENVIDFRPVTDGVAALLDGVDGERLAGPTPCEDYTQAALLNHLLGLSWVFTSAARKERGPHTDKPPSVPPATVEPAWRRLLPERLDALAEAWSDPAAWQGETTAGGVTLPAEAMGLVALNEVAVHGWDLARATGQDYELDPTIVEILLAFDGQDADDQSAREGIYAPVVKLPDGAPPQDRLIAITGRDPAWRP
ncbi:TIGR03086 family metal-binding protein [Glycomyces tarimensis]